MKKKIKKKVPKLLTATDEFAEEVAKSEYLDAASPIEVMVEMI